MSELKQDVEGAAALSPDSPMYVDADGHYEPFDYWLSLCGLYEYYDFALRLHGDLNGKRVLDCGCGPGHTSVMLARRGALVTAFDTSEEELTKARALAAANNVSIEFVNQPFEQLDMPEAHFDCAFGSCVLHHTDVAQAADALQRVLKPGAKAVFVENSALNPLLMGARAFLCGRLGIPKYRDELNEYPLRQRDLDAIGEAFSGEFRVHRPYLVLLRLLDFYVFKARSVFITDLLRGADRALGKVPGMNRFGYFQVLELVKPGSPSAEPSS
ncbi:MAG: class I SAM-dependent methyltransferase [Gammaproteobacteria bacterium]|nr:class I SAM-dependent methyltransferase [Gammaproteobacteria bacterium]NNL99607.1 class I SAM-dependent methyltransferase [Gammaproteobacteria bacterium]